MTAPSRTQGRWSVLDALNWTVDFFKKATIGSPRLDAELLLAEVLGIERIQLYVQYDRPLDGPEREAFRALVLRRANGEPVQYILGRQEFWSLTFEVGPGVLVPRPDTEVVVEEAVAEGKRLLGGGQSGLTVADVGTGSGAIAAALATEFADAAVWAGELSPAALSIARRNIARLALDHRVRVVAADLLGPLVDQAGTAFDLVVSNPPYIRSVNMPTLMREVREHEPHQALVGDDPDGLGHTRRIVEQAAAGAINPGGALVIEIGDAEQAVLLSELLEQTGFEGVRQRDDYGGRVRAVVGRWPNR